MGVQMKDILEFEEVDITFLNNKKVAVDSFNMLYQFLASIRQPDGNPLTDSKGAVTSHLKGLFNRCVYFKKNNIKAVFVFDGVAPKLKEKERELRLQRRMEADTKYKEAVELGLMDEARKYSSGLNRLDEQMIEDSISLIELFGFPVIRAPSEGEAQASFLVKKGMVFASASQDFDSLLFGSKYLLRNVSVSAKRKIAGTSTYKDIPVELYDLEKNLKRLNVSLDELIVIAILCGTDFNPGGVKGIGPKKALKLVKEYRDRWEDLFKALDWFSYFPYTWYEVFNTIKKMPADDVKEIAYGEIRKEKIKNFLVSKDFDEASISRSLSGIKNVKTLDKFF